MMLRARFLRFCHLLYFFYSRQAFTRRGPPCQAVTWYRGWRTTHVMCECGKEWK